ncbi:hypothetical protein GCM10007036_32220 [Alsobacter metallidurans]|uniref:Uncharacterized protein n=1 Tax=Alsobacter metallidurans TaxID=340221 RepID=A0A917I980_9HYPH|nr:hypothetical protein [Alsobacter metallidurans]GGH25233.1 hypothetical protein GCM10007036_32220 [Alsobacter metallidurans]
MNANRIQNVVIRTIEKQSIALDDVREIQRLIEDAGISKEEAEGLIRMERMVGQACDAWAEFFVEALTAHLVWERRPTGYIRDEDAAWLITCLQMARSGPALNVGPLLVNLVREAERVDQAVIALALEENRGLRALQDPEVALVRRAA